MQLLTASRIMVTMPEFGHVGSFYVNVDETIGASEDEDLEEEEDEEEDRLGSFGGVTLPEWTEDVDSLAGEWFVTAYSRPGAGGYAFPNAAGATDRVLVVRLDSRFAHVFPRFRARFAHVLATCLAGGEVAGWSDRAQGDGSVRD